MKFRELIQSKFESKIEEASEFSLIELNEVQFDETKLKKVVDLYSKILSRQFNGSFKLLGLEDYNRKTGPGKGFRVMNDKGVQLRFNWDAKKSKSAQFDLTSIDYWANTNTDFQKPTRTVMFSPTLNVVQVLDKIADALKIGSINEAQELIENARLIMEGPSFEDKQSWLVSKGMPKSLAKSEKVMRQKAAEKGLSSELEIFLGQKETNSFENEIKDQEKKFNEKVYSDPETVFDDIEDLLSVVASKKWRTLVVCGMGGVGKTFHITEGPRSLSALLGPEGKKWTYHSGTKAAPFSFYSTLFQERDKIIVFDEADSILKNNDIIMMLKPILDTSGNNMAEYMSGTKNMVGKSLQEIEEYSKLVDKQLSGVEMKDDDDESDNTAKLKLPSKFKFEGGMIFISNMRANQIDQAIMSRSIFIDVHLAEQDVLKRIKSIGYAQAKGKSGITKADVDDVLEALGQSSIGKDEPVTYMTPEYARKHKQVTVRAMQLALTLKKAGLARWAELAALYA